MAAAPRTIGQVLEAIRSEFPDISVSKLRYLEQEGLISPERDHPSGYRRFYPADVDRLLFILRAQRDRYLPLKVIREQLDAMDRGEILPQLADNPGQANPPASSAPETPAAAPRPQVRRPQLLSRRELLAESGLGEAALVELERLKLICHRVGTQVYGREALGVALAAKRLGDFGVDLRQLRLVQQAATMEAALAEQALSSYQRRQGVPPELRNEVYKIVMQAHTAMLFSQLAQ